MGKNTVTVLEIGSSKIICVVASQIGRKFEILGYGTCGYTGYKYDFESRSYTYPEEKSFATAMLRAIKYASGEANQEITDVTIACGAPFIKSDVVKSSIMMASKKRAVVPDDESRLMKIAGRNVVPVGYIPIHSTAKDFFADGERSLTLPIGKSVKQLEANFIHVFLDKQFASICENALASLNIKAKRFVSAPHAEALYLVEKEDAMRSSVVVDIGYRHTDITYLREGNVQNCNSIPIGAYNFANDIVYYKNISLGNALSITKKFAFFTDYTDAVEIIRKPDGGEDSIEKDDCSVIISSRMDELCDYIQQYMKYWNVDMARTVMYIAGGGSMMENTDDYISQKLGVDVYRDYPYLERSIINTANNISAFAAAAAVINPMWQGQNEDFELDEKPKKEGFFSRLFGKKSEESDEIDVF